MSPDKVLVMAKATIPEEDATDLGAAPDAAARAERGRADALQWQLDATVEAAAALGPNLRRCAPRPGPRRHALRTDSMR